MAQHPHVSSSPQFLPPMPGPLVLSGHLIGLPEDYLLVQANHIKGLPKDDYIIVQSNHIKGLPQDVAALVV